MQILIHDTSIYDSKLTEDTAVVSDYRVGYLQALILLWMDSITYLFMENVINASDELKEKMAN